MTEKMVTVQVNIPVAINHADMIAWLNECRDPSILKNISLMASRYAYMLENERPRHPNYDE